METKYDVFISYSRKDLELVKEIKAEIDRLVGIDCWMDLDGIESGEQFEDVIINVICKCDTILFMMSANSMQSEWALDELDFAKHEKKRIVLVSIDNTEMSCKFYFRYHKYDTITWSNEPQREKLIRNLKEWVCWEEQKEVKGVSLQKTEEPFIILKDKSLSILQNLANNMVYIEGGSFLMGNSILRDCDAFEDEMPIHEVNISSFYICKYEVTQDEWMFIMGNNPSFFTGSKRPVDNISWDDSQLFIKKLNELTGKQFRLSTEAEWEYAARGGMRSHGFNYAGSDIIQDVAWFEDNSNGRTHEVGSKMPNELGLFDMSGNVFEWCQDWYGNYPVGIQNNPSGPISGEFLVNRGGSWNNLASNCRVTDRLYDTSSFHDSCSGFRLAHNYEIAPKP